MHGLRYIGFIADGDSGVHKAVVNCPDKCGPMKKIESANNAFPEGCSMI